ncbi:MAG: NAD(P)-dependent oxidoreductase [Thermoleophilaceae bacterium]|nr:NAD(P)-dependent oxidoreductase [Thermoleophilaceae bacterium]
MGSRRVLVTGAEGTIGTAVREHLADRYELSSLTLTLQEFPSHVADIAELEAIQPAFENVDAVVHLAASPAIETPWDDVLSNNIVGTYNVFEAARQAGVERIVFASSNHAVGMYELDGAPGLYDLTDERRYDHEAEIRPDSLYGVSKAYGEALGRFYADRHGLRVFCLRIGAVRSSDDPTVPSENPLLDLDAEGRRNRMRAVWLSRRDCAELIARCLDVDDVSFAIVYGVSDNPRRFWDLTHARDLLGWEPQDAAPL